MSGDTQPPNVARFRATVVVPILNHERYVGAQLESLFAQWRADIDLLVVDDGSSDLSFEVVRTALRARPDIPAMCLRNERTLGLGILPQILAMTDSPILIQADSDDISLPDRISAILERFDQDPRCQLVSSNAFLTSEYGDVIGLMDVELDDTIFDDPREAAGVPGDVRWIGCTLAYRRSLIEGFPLDADVCPYGLDLILPLRATLLGTHHYIARPLVEYRQHDRNTNRVAGAQSGDRTRQERYQSLELRAAMQRVIDVKGFLETHPKSDQAASTLVKSQELLLDKVKLWGRLRTSLESSNNPVAENPGQSTLKLPPVPTLLPGVRYFFQSGCPLGAAAAAWRGFYAAEPNGIWTDRRAVMVMRAPGAKVINVCFTRLPGHTGNPPSRLCIRGQPWVEICQPNPLGDMLELSPSHDNQLITLWLEAPGAARPVDVLPDNVDTRRLGMFLCWIEVA